MRNILPDLRSPILALAFAIVPLAATAQLAPTNPLPSISLAWDPSTGTNIAGYKIYFGVGSRAYTNVTAFDIVTNATITLPPRPIAPLPSVTYYFAATAYDSTGLESVFSNEVTWTVYPAPVPVANARIIRGQH